MYIRSLICLHRFIFIQLHINLERNLYYICYILFGQGFNTIIKYSIKAINGGNTEKGRS